MVVFCVVSVWSSVGITLNRSEIGRSNTHALRFFPTSTYRSTPRMPTAQNHDIILSQTMRAGTRSKMPVRMRLHFNSRTHFDHRPSARSKRANTLPTVCVWLGGDPSNTTLIHGHIPAHGARAHARPESITHININ